MLTLTMMMTSLRYFCEQQQRREGSSDVLETTTMALRQLIHGGVTEQFEIFIDLFHLGLIALAWWGHVDALNPACGLTAQEPLRSSRLSYGQTITETLVCRGCIPSATFGFA